MQLPLPVWLCSLVPVCVGLITGGYLKNVKTPIISAEMEALPEMSQSPPNKLPAPELSDWTHERVAEYARVDGYMLAHVYRPSALRGQAFDIFIFVVRHRKDTAGPPRQHLDDIETAEFFFGNSWSNQVFTVHNSGSVIGVRTHAWGTFLATCRLTFRNRSRKPIILHRYIDFHMLQDQPDEA